MNISNLDEVKRACLVAFPQEACFTVKDGVAIEQENTHASPSEAFRMSQEVSLDLSSIQAIIHSHTHTVNSGTDFRAPSLKDMELAVATTLPQGIVHCNGEETSSILWFNDDSEIINYLGRPYIPNVYDCLTLVRDYYIKEFGHHMSLLPRPHNWLEWNKDYMVENLDNQGLERVSLNALSIGDVLVFRLSGITCHLGIVTGEDEFIHHLDKRGSCADGIYKWRRQIAMAYRL